MNLIIASHNDKILNKNIAASKFYKSRSPNSLKVVRGHTNISMAYNIATNLCEPLRYFVYSHHDLYLPDNFEDSLCNAISKMNCMDPGWGILGCAGATIENGQRKFYGHVKDRGREWGTAYDLPKEVQTIDELLLITKGDFVFDEQFDLHFYGADICLEAIKQGRKNYVIDAYCHHNSTLPLGYRSESFLECERKFKEKWKDWLPVSTTCTIIQ